MSPSDQPTARDDPGLQPERTALAWQRTAISFAAASLLFLRWATQHGPLVVVLVMAAVATATWIFVHTRTRLRRVVHHFPSLGLEPAASEVLVVTAAATILGVAAVWVTLAT